VNAAATPASRKSARTDAVLLLAHAAGWLALARYGALAAWSAPALVLAAAASTLAVCKGLSWPPRWRALAALVPVLAAAVAQDVEAERGAWLAGRVAMAATAAYLVFGWTRRGWQALAFHGPDGRRDGFDYGRWYRWSERVRGRARRRPWRVLFPCTDKEATLRAADWQRGDRIAFADVATADFAAHDLVVPLSAHDLAACEPLRARFAGHAIAMPARACIELCDDKPRLNRTLVAQGFGAHVPAMDGPFAFPYIVKKRRAEWGEHSHVVASADDERRLAALLADPDYFRQAYVPGCTEYTTHVLVRGGRLVRSLTVEFTFAHAHPVKSRQCASVAIRLRRGVHDRLFAAMLRAIGFEGLGCFNYKRVDGQPLVFESALRREPGPVLLRLPAQPFLTG
jgi:hypothetical protein